MPYILPVSAGSQIEPSQAEALDPAELDLLGDPGDYLVQDVAQAGFGTESQDALRLRDGWRAHLDVVLIRWIINKSKCLGCFMNFFPDHLCKFKHGGSHRRGEIEILVPRGRMFDAHADSAR